MSIERDQLRKIAELARLDPGEADLAGLTGDLNAILGHIDQLSRWDVAGRETGPREPVGPTSASGWSGGPPLASTRDTSGEAADRMAAGPSSVAPRWSDGFYSVPPLPGVQYGGDEEDR